MKSLKLIIFHYHLRAGGVRRVIELAAPFLLQGLKNGPHELILATGEPPERNWLNAFKNKLAGIPVTVLVNREFGYISEQKKPLSTIRTSLRLAFSKLLGEAPKDTMVWSHNPGLGRNLLVNQQLVRETKRYGVPLLFHHHDLWFDNRWTRWPEIRKSGFRTLRSALAVTFPLSSNVRHICINRSDFNTLCRSFPNRTFWIPNLASRSNPVTKSSIAAAKGWLETKIQKKGAPVWILPCRLLRRKNIAESLLLMRWLRPQAWLISTAGISSDDERAYARGLQEAARRHNWPVLLGALEADRSPKPTVPELLAASEAVMLTSLVEGFGLPYVEAAASKRPLIARMVPQIAPDLSRFGFRFPQSYKEIHVDPSLFDWAREVDRQGKLYKRWKSKLPRACQRSVGIPQILSTRLPCAVPFSRLTLSAQIEILSQPLEKSWEYCAPLNPFLPVWRDRAKSGSLEISIWPKSAEKWLGGNQYARRFAATLQELPQLSSANGDTQVALGPVEARLESSQLFPLLWASHT